MPPTPEQIACRVVERGCREPCVNLLCERVAAAIRIEREDRKADVALRQSWARDEEKKLLAAVERAKRAEAKLGISEDCLDGMDFYEVICAECARNQNLVRAALKSIRGDGT